MAGKTGHRSGTQRGSVRAPFRPSKSDPGPRRWIKGVHVKGLAPLTTRCPSPGRPTTLKYERGIWWQMVAGQDSTSSGSRDAEGSAVGAPAYQPTAEQAHPEPSRPRCSSYSPKAIRAIGSGLPGAGPYGGDERHRGRGPHLAGGVDAVPCRMGCQQGTEGSGTSCGPTATSSGGAKGRGAAPGALEGATCLIGPCAARCKTADCPSGSDSSSRAAPQRTEGARCEGLFCT